MTRRYRRVIHRPASVTNTQWARLQEALAHAIHRQKLLADESPHVLRFIDDLEEETDSGALYIEHEPARVISVTELYNPETTRADEATLVQTALGLFSALAAEHGKESRRPTAHGGVCPGTLLFGADGTAKLTDFGFAEAVCGVLGVDAYLNLAVGPRTGNASDEDITAVWEVLDPTDFERDDRLCAFIDPQKYGSRTLEAFEPGSDVIAASFVLHLMAEHQHAYLYADPGAHRMVEMSEFMGMGKYNGARRKDLRESPDPQVKLWCELIGKTLSRLPQDRPTAAEMVEALSGEATAEQIGRVLQRHAVLPKRKTTRPATDPAAKPSPEPVTRALRELGCERAWLVGDTVDDVRAARAAGVVPIGVLAPGGEADSETESLSTAGAARVVANLNEIESLLP